MDTTTKEYNAKSEEIQELERLLEEKKRQLAERGEAREPKEVFREVFKERFVTPERGKEPAAPVLTPPPILSQPVADGQKVKVRDEQLVALIQIAFEKGIASAIQVARSSTPWLLDELHDRLIDEYYEKLIQARQIKPA